MTCVALPEYAQLLYPINSLSGDYRQFYYLALAVHGDSLAQAITGLGKAPSRFITQRGPYQDGETPLDMRWDGRNLYISFSRYYRNRYQYQDAAYDFLDALRPNRAFDPRRAAPQPLILRYFMPGGKVQRDIDLVTTAGSTYVYSARGRFVHWGLKPGEPFVIETGADAGTYIVASVPNDYTAELTVALTTDDYPIQFSYRRAQAYRDIYLLLNDGPALNAPAGGHGSSIVDTLSFIAHDPFWYGEEQSYVWEVPAEVGDLVFDGEGAWLGATPGIGRWLFLEDSVNQTLLIKYWGHEVAFPVITLTGPMVTPVFINSTLDITLTLNYTLGAGEVVTIDTQNTTVENNLGDNLLAYLTGNLAGFGVYPEPQAPNRENIINVSFSGADPGASAAVLAFRNKYIGLA